MEKIIENLYNIFFEGKTTNYIDDIIEYNIKVYLSKLSKFEVACLNEYCGLDNINTNVERLALKLMSKFYDRFENEKNKNIKNLTNAKENARFIKETSGKKMTISIIAFFVGIAIALFMGRNGNLSGLTPFKIFIIYFGVGCYFYLVALIFLRIGIFVSIVSFIVSLGWFNSIKSQDEQIQLLIFICFVAIIILALDISAFIENKNESNETDKLADDAIKKINNNYISNSEEANSIEMNRKT